MSLLFRESSDARAAYRPPLGAREGHGTGQGGGGAGLSFRGRKKTFVTPTETNVHRNALCFMVMGPSLLQRLAVGGWWRLAVGGGWRLVVPGGCP